MENVLYINIIVENVFDKFYGKVNSTEIVESVLSINWVKNNFSTNSMENWIPLKYHDFCGKINSTKSMENVLPPIEWKIIFHKFYGKLNSTEVSWFLWKNEFHEIFPSIEWKIIFHKFYWRKDSTKMSWFLWKNNYGNFKYPNVDEFTLRSKCLEFENIFH